MARPRRGFEGAYPEEGPNRSMPSWSAFPGANARSYGYEGMDASGPPLNTYSNPEASNDIPEDLSTTHPELFDDLMQKLASERPTKATISFDSDIYHFNQSSNLAPLIPVNEAESWQVKQSEVSALQRYEAGRSVQSNLLNSASHLDHGMLGNGFDSADMLNSGMSFGGEMGYGSVRSSIAPEHPSSQQMYQFQGGSGVVPFQIHNGFIGGLLHAQLMRERNLGRMPQSPPFDFNYNGPSFPRYPQPFDASGLNISPSGGHFQQMNGTNFASPDLPSFQMPGTIQSNTYNGPNHATSPSFYAHHSLGDPQIGSAFDSQLDSRLRPRTVPFAGMPLGFNMPLPPDGNHYQPYPPSGVNPLKHSTRAQSASTTILSSPSVAASERQHSSQKKRVKRTTRTLITASVSATSNIPPPTLVPAQKARIPKGIRTRIGNAGTYGEDVADRPPVEARLPSGIDISAVEIMTFYPNALQLPDVAVRLYSAGFTKKDLAKMFLYVTGNLTQDKLNRNGHRIQKQLGFGCKAFAHISGERLHKATHFGQTQINDLTANTWRFRYQHEGRVGGLTFKDVPLASIIAPVATGIWPQGADRLLLTQCLEYARANPHLRLTTADFANIIRTQGFQGPAPLNSNHDVQALNNVRQTIADP